MSGFKSDQQRKWFFATGMDRGERSENMRLYKQSRDDRIYGGSYQDIREGREASPELIAAYFRSADVEAMNKKHGA